MGVYGMNMGPSLYQSNNRMSLDQVKGTRNGWDADFEAAFAQATASLPPAQAEAPKIVEVDSEVTNIQESLSAVTLETNKENDVGDQGTDLQA
jgi:peroxin-5